MRPTWVSSHQGWSTPCETIVRNLVCGPAERTGEDRRFPGGAETDADRQGLSVCWELGRARGDSDAAPVVLAWADAALLEAPGGSMLLYRKEAAKTKAVGFVKTWASHLLLPLRV